ncbi:MAG TPA: hypothetical protein VE291_02445 [Terracidiphilus sp.]|jgi:hypothetical protein|nr:hypothetical protein [Terracidiphilus sp.]
MRRSVCFALSLLFLLPGLRASAQAFDLAGPKVDVHVKRGQVTLPIGQVPNLLPGDRLWIHPDFPDSQSAHYVLIVAFLRGITNPPPNGWFTHVETWSRQVHDEGVFVTVPQEAQQAIMFLAPETGGDFNTLRDTVRGRPGIFVRATQDLQAASWDRMRLDAYLNEIKTTSQTDPKSLKLRAETAARSLGIKVNQECFDRPIEQQATCLTQHTEGLVVDDSNTQTRVDQLTGGSAGDLVNQISFSSVAGGGTFSPYVGAIVDTARILASLHTAHYQYLPALALPTEDTLNLKLSVPPSFRDPKSVVIVALPPIGPVVFPPLHPVDPSQKFCAQKPGLVLPAEGAPLVLATQIAHNLVLRIETRIDSKKGPVDLPVRIDAAEGGIVLEHSVPLLPATGAPAGLPDDEVKATLRGKWGFDDWEGPTFQLHSAQQGIWKVSESDQSALVVGREDTLHLEGDSDLCVEKIRLVAARGNVLPLTWKSPKPDALAVSVPLTNAVPGPVKLEISQYGLAQPDTLALNAYAEAASLDRLSLSAGDSSAVLTGTRLDEVAKATLDGVTWHPVTLGREQDVDELSMTADRSTASLAPGKSAFAAVLLRDGRELKAHAAIDPPRPQITLLSKGAQDANAQPASPVQFGSTDDLPADRRLVFFLKSKIPSSFPRDEKIEVAAADGSFKTTLSLTDSSLMLEDATTALGVIEPLVRFGSSAFGPIEARPVAGDGATGDWLPLGTLVRQPGFKELHCPRALSKPCTLTGSNLFLATAVSATSDFGDPSAVPPDFTGTQLTVPHPAGGLLYIKLRDDPSTVQTLTLPVLPVTTAGLPGHAAPHAAEPVTQPEPPAAEPAAQPAPAAANAAPPPGSR